MKICIGTLAALVTSVAFGDKVAVDWLDVDGLAVTNESETVTQEDSIVLADGATFAKVGAGKLVLPLDKIDKTFDYTVRVAGGALELEKGGAYAPGSGAPAWIAQKAALWLDASTDASLVFGDEGNVTRWCDRRETDKDSPTRHYAQTAVTSDAVTKIPQTYVNKDGTNAVYFGGLDETSGSFMKLQRAGADAEIQTVRHVFAVHGTFECWNALFAAKSGARDYFTDDRLASPVNRNYHYIWYGHVSPGAYTARHYLDGVRFDPYSVGPKVGFQLLEDEYVDKPTQVFYIFNNMNVLRRVGGDYLSEVVLFTNQLTVAERLDVERYLLRKWRLGTADAQPGRGVVEVAPGASLKLPQERLADGELAVKGVGEVVAAAAPLYVGAGLFAQYDGELALTAGELRVVKGVVPNVRLAVGDEISADNETSCAADVYTNAALYAEKAVHVMRTANKAAAGTIVKRGSEDVSVSTLPQGLKKLVVAEGNLNLRGVVTNVGLVADAALCAYIPNADFEEPCTADKTYNRSLFASGQKKNHWARSGSETLVGYLVENYSAGDTFDQNPHSRSTFSPFPIRQGAQVLIICNNGAAYTDEAYFPKSGYYELSVLESTRYPTFKTDQTAVSGASYEVKVGETWASATTRAQRRVANAGDYTRVRIRLGFIEAGTKAFGFQAASWMKSDGALLLDDIRVRFVGELPEPGLVEIPNGDFEAVTNRTAVGENKNPYFIAQRDASNEVEGWTFVNENELAAVAAVSASAPPTYTTSQGTDLRLSDTADGLCGSVHLSFHGSGGSASTTFVVPAGTYRLRGKLARWSADWKGVNGREHVPVVKATVTVAGDTVMELGEVSTSSHMMTEQLWPESFELTEETEVSLTLAQTKEKGAALLDDLVLVDLERDGAASDELIVNGGFESGTSTTDFAPWVRFSDSSAFGGHSINRCDPWEDFRLTPGNDVPKQFGGFPYDGKFYVRLINNEGLYQTVKLDKGLYRLSFATHMRNTGGYNRQPIAAYLADQSGNKVLDIGWTHVGTYNDIEHVWFFRVKVAGAYRLCLQGTDYWKDQHAVDGKNHTSMLDGVSLRRVFGDEVKPSIPETTKIDIAEGSMVRLDFDGSVTVGAVTYDGERYLGEISAKTHPEFVQGRGVLNATPSNKGMVLIYR